MWPDLMDGLDLKSETITFSKKDIKATM